MRRNNRYHPPTHHLLTTYLADLITPPCKVLHWSGNIIKQRLRVDWGQFAWDEVLEGEAFVILAFDLSQE